MKIKNWLSLAVITMFMLSACEGNASAAPLSAEEIISGANTIVALTSKSQIEMTTTSAATSTPLPAMTTTALIRPIDNQLIKAEPVSTPLYSPPDGTSSNCDNSVYVSDVSIPDETVFAPGETFTKKWNIQNTGTCTWNSSYAITFSSGDGMSGETTTIHRAVPPNGSSNVSVELTAPDTAGTYTGYWIMSNSSGTIFGNYVYVKIVVVSDN